MVTFTGSRCHHGRESFQLRSEPSAYVSRVRRSQKVSGAVKVIPRKVPLLSWFTLGMINSDRVSKPSLACDLTGVL